MIRRFFRDEEGANLVEYALLVTLIAIAVIIGVTALGKNINLWFSGLATQVSTWTNSI